jgi:GT2 family glycosyltransferase
MFRESYDSVKMRGVSFDELMEVDQPSGAALFLRRNALNAVGLLDECFFMFFEEVDLCKRIRNAGYTIYLVPCARVTHYGGRSRRQNRARIIRPAAESMIRYFRKHEGPLRTSLFELAFRPLFALGVCIDAVRAGSKVLVSRLRGDRRARAAEKEEVFRAYAAFIKRDLLPFLLQLWE